MFPSRGSFSGHETPMALPIDDTYPPRDPRTLKILAKSIYRELRTNGYEERDVMAFTSELLSLLSREVRERRESDLPPSRLRSSG
jgi:hypothetical protein